MRLRTCLSVLYILLRAVFVFGKNSILHFHYASIFPYPLFFDLPRLLKFSFETKRLLSDFLQEEVNITSAVKWVIELL